jgi:Dolichyl-phosphate-mannose-protein mannosyltransferase
LRPQAVAHLLFVIMSWQSFETTAWWFRLTYGTRPFWLFLGLTIALSILRAAWRRSGVRAFPLPTAARVGLAGLVIASYAAVAIWYLRLDGFFDHAEPTIAAVAWLFHIGKPIYHAADSAERYAHIYGPFAFMIPGSFLAWFGPGLVQAKLPGTIAGLATVVVVYRLARSVTTTVNALTITAVFAIAALAFRNLAFWVRPDSFLMCCAAVALLGATGRHWAVSGIVVGLACGVMVDLKLTGPLYALPALGMVIATHGWRAIVLLTPIAIATALSPFLLFDNVSFANFWHWFEVSAQNGLWFHTLRQNVDWALFLLVPVVPALIARPAGHLDRIRRAALVGLALGVVAVSIAAAKPGAGPDHMMPFLPAAFYLTALSLGSLAVSVGQSAAIRAGVPAFVMAVLAIALAQQVFFITWSARVAGLHLSDDLAGFADAHPGRTMAMGFTRVDAHLTFARPVLVFRTGSYPLDAPAIQEEQLAGLALPAATIRAMADCTTEFWLFPKVDLPFTATSIYPFTAGDPLFPDEFRQMFAAHYHRVDDTANFQVWQCRDSRQAFAR